LPSPLKGEGSKMAPPKGVDRKYAPPLRGGLGRVLIYDFINRL